MHTELWMTALASWRKGHYDEAVRILENLLTKCPNDNRAHHLYGIIKTEMGDYDEAIKQLQFVCTTEPVNDEALSNLGNAQRLANKVAEAEATLRLGLVHNPGNQSLHFNLGVLLKSVNRPQEAETEFLHASELDPSDQASWIQLGLLRYARSDHLNAASAFLEASRLDGDERALAIRLAGFTLADGGRPDKAEGLLASLCPEGPQETDDFHLLSQLLYCRLELCDWRQMPEIIERCRQFMAEGRAPLEPFTFLLLPGISSREQLALTSNFVQSLVTTGRPVVNTVAQDIGSGRCIRVGYLSADFHDHAVMRLLVGVLEHHNHHKFEIHAFSYGGPDESEMRRRIVAACDHFHDVSQFSPELLAQRISSMSIDILVDLTGWTGNTRSVALGYRPAPIQVNWLGYSGTFGSRLLADYLIGDPLATPLSDQSNFAEELVLMPVCCQPNDASRRIGKARTRVAEGLPESGFVFCCFSRPLKITPQLFQCWCDLLLALPASVLWLLAANDVAKTNLVNEAGHRGIDASRLVFSSPIPPHEHLARLSLADLALDTFPFGAHTTASDALWAGLPVITLMGDTLASRVTASMLNAIGLNELVTHSIDAYRARALELANNSTLLSSIRERLELKRISSSLFDTKEFAVALEALFRSMWQRHCLDNGHPR